MKIIFKKLKLKKKLDPRKPKDREKLINEAVSRTVKEYGKTLQKLGSD